MKNSYWLSFADARNPPGEQFLGVIVTQADDFKTAMEKTHQLGINPGGQIQGFDIPGDKVKAEHYDRLMSKAELLAHGYITYQF